MLKIPIMVNDHVIDMIKVVRVANDKNLEVGYNSYRIMAPSGFYHIPINHYYNEGYLPLLLKVLEVLKAFGYKSLPEYTWKELRKINP